MKINLTYGDYQPRSVLASCQRRLNMYSELIDPKTGEPAQVIHYPTPGLRVLGTTPNNLPIRGLYRASNGDVYACSGFDIYYIDRTWQFHLVGSLNHTDTLNVVKFADNGTSVILCDGTAFNGWSINMKTRTGLSPLFDPSAGDAETTASTGWLGSTYVDFSDGFFIANSIGTPSFYISNAQDVIFDPLQFAGKTSYPDAVIAAIAQHRVIWLIGSLSTEVWYNSGGGSIAGNNFPFEIMPGVAIDWGCRAPYSIAKAESSVFWLAQNLNGETQVLRGLGYAVHRISTHAIEHIFSTYADVSDCIGYCYMRDGHTFYVMTFASADATWVYDLATDRWHQLAFNNASGEHRHRSTMHCFAYDTDIVNDWQNGNLYVLDINAYTDFGNPIKRVVGFPRQIDQENGNRIVFKSFVAEIDAGETFNPDDNVTMMLTWSDDKGRTWSNAIAQSLGKSGEFAKLVQWQRLGISRNRVFRLEWTTNGLVALQGAFVEIVKSSN